MTLRAARQRTLVERPEGALPARRAGPDGGAARGAVRLPAPRLAPRREPAGRHPRAHSRRLRAGRVEHRAALPRDPLRGHADLPLRPPRPRNGQLAARRHRHLPAAGALSHRAGGLRPPRRQGSRRRAARRRRRQRRLRGRAAQARAIPGPARRRLAVGLLRPLHDRRRGGGTRAAPPAPDGTRADRDPAPRCLGRGLLRAARPGSAWRRPRASSQRPAGRRSRLRAASRRAPAPAACRATGSGRGSSSRRAAPRARAPDGRTSRARRR